MPFVSAGRHRAAQRFLVASSAFCILLSLGLQAAIAATKSDSTPHEAFFYMSCSNTPCERQMYRVPDHQRLRVFALSCAAQLRTQGAVSRIGVRRQLSNGGTEITDFAANQVGVQGNTHYFAYRGGPNTIVDGGGVVDAFVDFTGELDAFYCFLAGDLVETR